MVLINDYEYRVVGVQLILILMFANFLTTRYFFIYYFSDLGCA